MSLGTEKGRAGAGEGSQECLEMNCGFSLPPTLCAWPYTWLSKYLFKHSILWPPYCA